MLLSGQLAQEEDFEGKGLRDSHFPEFKQYGLVFGSRRSGLRLIGGASFLWPTLQGRGHMQTGSKIPLFTKFPIAAR